MSDSSTSTHERSECSSSLTVKSSSSESSDSSENSSDANGATQLGSHVPSMSDSDVSSSSGSADTSSATSRSVARPQVRKIDRLLESRQQHLLRHVDAAVRRKCQRCRYYAQHHALQRRCSLVLAITNEMFTWLMEHPGAETGSHEWGLGCCICRWAGLDTKMAQCQKQCLIKLERHQNSSAHKRAEQKWLEAQICPALGSLAAEAPTNPPGAGGSISASTRTFTGGETPVSQESHLEENVGYGHVIKILEIFQEQNSIRSFSRSVEAGRVMKSDLNAGNGSRTVAHHLVSTCAGYELSINRRLLLDCAIWGLGQDGRDTALLVASRMVLWSLPIKMRKNLPDGVTAVLPSCFGSKGPWVGERALGCGMLASERGGQALAKSTLQILRTTLPAPGDFEAVAKKARFFTADNAADETIAHRCLREEFGDSLEFDISDTTHCVMLGIKNGCKGDPEVDLVRGVFLTNKRPMPSISRCLQNSTRFRSQFTEQQQDGIETTVSHLGWAPQRHSSQSRPWGRGSRKIHELMSALAKEVDRTGQYSKACLHNLRTMAPFGRMMLAGMLGDLTAEHLLLVHRVFWRTLCYSHRILPK